MVLTPSDVPTTTVCIIGAGIGGSSVAHFLRKYYPNSTPFTKILIFEKNPVVGGRMATVTIGGHTFEAGASILHPKNLHAASYAKLLNLKVKQYSSKSPSLGIWDGNKLVFNSVNIATSSSSCCNIPLIDKLGFLATHVTRLFLRYGVRSFLKTKNLVDYAVERFSKYYEGGESRPVFETVDDMLKWAGLYHLTTTTLKDELLDAGSSPLFIDELVNVITRVNYGQSVRMSALAGTISIAGSSAAGVWSIKGGNWKIAAGLIKESNAVLRLNEEIDGVARVGDCYELKSTKGKRYKCDVVVVATPLDELNIRFTPPISPIPERKLQHTYATFVWGLLNHEYFGLKCESEVPEVLGTVEDPDLPFSCIAIIKEHNEKEFTYKIFSRQPMEDTLLDRMFSVRKETVRKNWAAYPQYHAPEVFAPFILDGRHLYYVNAFENAASTMETSAVAAENIARLILSRYFKAK
ncbi:hypothetical protein RIF29_16193 [Crotalaria pallida]|uniref:Prenylcysteine lyase domain-containing protein n=1 Tax=Crotalaria pallida TaxID=3830 RepID=A0AAN9FIF2_CROPI